MKALSPMEWRRLHLIRAQRALSLVILAAAVMANPGDAVERGTTADDRQAAPAIERLRAEAEVVQAMSLHLHDAAGRTLVHLADAAIADARLRAAAVAATASVMRLSYRLSQSSRRLGDGWAQASASSLLRSDVIADQLAIYQAAQRRFEQYARGFSLRMDAVRNPDGTDASDQLQAFTLAAAAYESRSKALDAAISGIEEVLLPPRTRNVGKGMALSVYGFVDDMGPIDPGYGLYTYVLFPAETERNVALIEALLGTTPEDLFVDDRAAVNLFAIPVRSRVSAETSLHTPDAAADIASRAIYDYTRAARILGSLCLGSRAAPPELCAGNWRGPFLLTCPGVLTSSEPISPPYLLVDLSSSGVAAFGEYVDAVKQQVMLADFTNREKIDTFRLQLLDVTLMAADWLYPIKEGITGATSSVARQIGQAIPAAAAATVDHQRASPAGAPRPDHDAPAVMAAPPRWDALYDHGYRLQLRGDLAAAIEMYREAAKLAPRHAATFYNWGYVLQKQGDYAGAIEKYRQAIALKPDYAHAHYNLGYLLQRQGDDDGAIKSYRRASQSGAGNPFVYYNWAELLERRGELADAIELYRKASVMRPASQLGTDARVRIAALMARQAEAPSN